MFLMKVTVDVSNNFVVSTNAILSVAANKGNLSPMYVLVPDRFTLQAERVLLSTGRTMLNTRVITFSMLYNIVAAELGQGRLPETIDKTAAVLYLWRAVRDVSKDLKCFLKSASHYDFAEKMFNTINQMKSSRVDFEKMEARAKTTVAKKKFHDINLIYKRYKEIIGSKYDSAGQLDFLIENIKKCKGLQSADFFVCGFENLSVARLAVLMELCKNATAVHVGTVATGEFNSQIHVMETQIAESVGLNNMKPFLWRTIPNDRKIKEVEGIFSYPIKKQNLDFVSVGVFGDVRAEANAICAEIVSRVGTGTALGDITVVLNDFDNTAVVWEAVLSKYNIPANIDVGKRLNEFAITKYMRDMLELTINANPENTIASAFNIHSGVDGAELFEFENNIIRNNLYGQIKSQIKTENVKEICDSLLVFCDKESNEIVAERLKKILNTVADAFGNTKIDLREFINLFWTLALSTKVSNIPLYQNRVLVVSADEWVPTEVRHLFVANCSADNFPKGQNDDDILQEPDLAGTGISPTASQQRERNRRHIDVILSCVTQDVVLTAVSVNSAGEKTGVGDVLSNLKKMGAKDFVLNYDVVVDGFSNYICEQTNISCGGDLLVRNNTINTTMVERFYTCPYMNFIQNGLRLRPRDIYELKANVIGDIIHRAVKEYFQGIIDKKEISIDGAIVIAFGDEKYKNYMEDKKNKPIINNLKKEIKFIINTLVKNLRQGEFAPYKAEEKIQIPLRNITLKGTVDRVDKDNDYFAIYDYKTGAESSGLAKSIYMGEKLQLPIYASHFMKDGNIAGAGYLPLKGGYSSEEKTIRLNGFVDKDTVQLWDKNAGEKGYVSNVITGGKQLIDASTIQAICDYAKGMVSIAVTHILDGFVAAIPIDNEKCKYCPIGAVCGGGDNARDFSGNVAFEDFKEIKHVKGGGE